MRVLCLLLLLLSIGFGSAFAGPGDMAVSLYAGQLTGNKWDDFFSGEEVASEDSYLLAATLARRLGGYKNLLSYEIEGQVVRHFKLQEHWEFNALGVLRWEPFFWDEWLETSAAFGMGLSYATSKPEVEIENDGDSSQLLVYWMIELAIVPFAGRPELELLTRLHHRSTGYGLFAHKGGSNALAVGLRYRF
ncbi:MAG: hypothetical protein JXK94_08060 [Deltaproteobacteria bacterium]|nr:hypothetical protein [Deltaproteobacteria bacterium]